MASDEFAPVRRELKTLRSRLLWKRQGLVHKTHGVEQQVSKVDEMLSDLGTPPEEAKEVNADATESKCANGEQIQSIVTAILRAKPDGGNAAELRGWLYDELRKQGRSRNGAARILDHVIASPPFELCDTGKYRLAGATLDL